MTRKLTKPFGGRITAPSAPWLAPEFPVPIDNNDCTNAELEITISDIHLPAKQPRRYFDPEALQALAESIAQHGILQPLLVRPHLDGGYELVAGERRYRAAQISGLKIVPVIVRELNNHEAWQIALAENLQREDLNPIEETEGILDLLALELNHALADIPNLLRLLFNQTNRNKADLQIDNIDNNVIIKNQNSTSQPDNNVIITSINRSENSDLLQNLEQTFARLGRMSWQSFVTNRLPLLKLSESIIQALREGKIEYTKAKLIAGVKDEDLQKQILQDVIANKLSLNEIKDRIKESSQKSKVAKAPNLRSRFETTFKAAKASSVWEDAKKKKKLEALLNQLEASINL